MSKISQLHMELMEQASDLGFESLGEAEQAGYGVDWENGKLVKAEDELDKAHEAWLKEREEVVKSLTLLRERAISQEDTEDALVLGNAILFIKEQCHD